MNLAYGSLLFVSITFTLHQWTVSSFLSEKLGCYEAAISSVELLILFGF